MYEKVRIGNVRGRGLNLKINVEFFFLKLFRIDDGGSAVEESLVFWYVGHVG